MNDKTLEISTSKIITGIITALIIGAIGGGLGVIRVADSNALLIASQARTLEQLETSIVPRAEYEARNRVYETTRKQKIIRYYESDYQ